MAVIHAVKLTREWLNTTEFKNQGIKDEDITVDGRIHVPACRWEKTSGKIDEKKCQQKVTVVNKKSAALAQISVASSDNFTRVVLKKGIVKGLKDQQTISLPISQTGLVTHFGDFIKLDPSQTVHEDLQSQEQPINGPSTGPVLKEKSIGCVSTSAVVHYKKKESEWKFTCQNATLKAKVRINTRGGTMQYELAEIIRYLKETQHRDDLKDIKIESDEVRFTISGKVVFRWDSEYKVEW